jgi:hypothetical protein
MSQAYSLSLAKRRVESVERDAAEQALWDESVGSTNTNDWAGWMKNVADWNEKKSPDEVKLESLHLSTSNETINAIFLPSYIFEYSYAGESYRVFVCGVTGAVGGAQAAGSPLK